MIVSIDTKVIDSIKLIEISQYFVSESFDDSIVVTINEIITAVLDEVVLPSNAVVISDNHVSSSDCCNKDGH